MKLFQLEIGWKKIRTENENELNEHARENGEANSVGNRLKKKKKNGKRNEHARENVKLQSEIDWKKSDRKTNLNEHVKKKLIPSEID